MPRQIYDAMPVAVLWLVCRWWQQQQQSWPMKKNWIGTMKYLPFCAIFHCSRQVVLQPLKRVCEPCVCVFNHWQTHCMRNFQILSRYLTVSFKTEKVFRTQQSRNPLRKNNSNSTLQLFASSRWWQERFCIHHLPRHTKRETVHLKY